jgi:hypothetical protein
VRLAVTIKYSGRIAALSHDADIPRDGLSFRADGDAPKTLYVNGIEVGELMHWPVATHGEWAWTMGKPTPEEFVPDGYELRAWLELPHDVPWSGLFDHLTEDQGAALRAIVDEWIGEGFTTPPYTAAQYDIFEALDLAHAEHVGVSYDTRRPE